MTLTELRGLKKKDRVVYQGLKAFVVQEPIRYGKVKVKLDSKTIDLITWIADTNCADWTKLT